MNTSQLFNQSKSPWASRGVLGGIAGMVLGGVQVVGYTVSADDVATAQSLIVGIATSVAGLTALIGRVKATKSIKRSS